VQPQSVVSQQSSLLFGLAPFFCGNDLDLIGHKMTTIERRIFQQRVIPTQWQTMSFCFSALLCFFILVLEFLWA
jgi:hypothetical protein